ncbi:unnamed protein product (macronuclear) [Paramecium tetraurelia]|uniref:Uncharacterized protein n=1 Tax=Paramecium tetraurelia TaxID=5888 RepID=A0BF82_PARTE|nr:uncharacterized protein GSPATT00028234001 [Paramecium tetraurelia]CAK57199.1 unnamed protein product [Paramecium tetraurelia]|eukprot:XP_001424597.1 hypothetical protein (macronuclear) [Paramecium tetraurelia strain d4-2]
MKTVPSSRTHHSTHRSSKHSAQSDDHHIITLQNTQRLHRTLQKKGTFTIESVPDTNQQARNSIKSNAAVSPARNLLKTPTLIRKNSGYQVIKTNNRIETQQFNHHQPNNLATIPSLQELPDSVRQSEIQLIGEIKQNQDNRQNYFYTNTVYRVLTRCVISQGLIGCFLLLGLHPALCVLIDLVAVWIFRFLQSDRRWVQVLQLFISFGFDISILLLFQIDLTWTISLVVLIFVDSVLEVIILKAQRSTSSETIQTQN